MVSKVKIFPIANQIGLLKSIFPASTVTNLHDKQLIWYHKIKPSPLSDEYAIKLVYELGFSPKVFVMDPKPLTLAKSAKQLPHVYNQKKQHLCLYYPDGRQWNASMPLAKTIVWWAFEWLYHYELWLGTDDEWRGGGVHPYKNQLKKDINIL